METRRTFFAGCSMLALGLTALMIGLLWTAEREADQAGLYAEANYIPVILIGGAIFLFFALLSWRNDVGLREEERHQEQLSALQRGFYDDAPSEDDIIIRKARTLWRAGKQKEAIILLETLPSNPQAQRMLKQARQRLITKDSP